MPESPDRPNQPETPRHYAWPKYVLGAVALFFSVCTWWTLKEIGRLQRAKAEGMEMRQLPPAAGSNSAAQPTAPPGGPPR